MYSLKVSKLLYFFALMLLGLLPSFNKNIVYAQQPVVRAILFYSPSCGHCHLVIEQVLPPLIEKYGTQLEIIGINVATEDGQTLLLSALEYYKIDRAGVPTLIIGEHILMGSVDIPEQLPGLIEQYLAQGGVDWPKIPGLAEIIQNAQESAVKEPAPTTIPPTETLAFPTDQANLEPPIPPQPEKQETPTTSLAIPQPSSSVIDRVMIDPVGNGLSILVLSAMVIVFLVGVYRFMQNCPMTTSPWPNWSILLLSLVGIGVAGYLAYVETTLTTAVCGPIGDCNTVQQSSYARLFGFLPIGVLGVVGYFFIIAAWMVQQYGRPILSNLAAIALLSMSTGGIIFSIYLTFLEPFVIGATCAWCLTSAILMTLIFWLSLEPGRLTLQKLEKQTPKQKLGRQTPKQKLGRQTSKRKSP